MWSMFYFLSSLTSCTWKQWCSLHFHAAHAHMSILTCISAFWCMLNHLPFTVWKIIPLTVCMQLLSIVPLAQPTQNHNGHKLNQALVLLWGHFQDMDNSTFLSTLIKPYLHCVGWGTLTRLIRCLPQAECPAMQPASQQRTHSKPSIITSRVD